MKRSEFLKTIGGGLLALPAIPAIANNNKELTMTDTDAPTFTDTQLRYAKTKSHDELSNLINDIIEITGGKINGYPIYRTPVPVFVNEKGNIKVAKTHGINSYINTRWVYPKKFYSFFVTTMDKEKKLCHEFKIEDVKIKGTNDHKQVLNDVLVEDKATRDLLNRSLIISLEQVINKPTYLYSIGVNMFPIIDPFNSNCKSYGNSEGNFNQNCKFLISMA